MKSEKDWVTDDSSSGSDDNDLPGSSSSSGRKPPKRVRLASTTKKLRKEINWNGNNTRTLIGAIKRDKDLLHDFTTVLDGKITGREVRLEELKSVTNVIGTRSSAEPIQPRIETRSKKVRKGQQYNVKPFTEAQLPSDDENDVEFDADANQEEEEVDSDNLSDNLSDYYNHHESESQMSLRSIESIQISKKTRSKVTITEPIEKLVQKFNFPDVEDIPLEPLLNYEQDEIWTSFLNDTFIKQVEHQDDDEEDDDFNPNEFVDELLEGTKDEVQFGIISRKEARDLQYDALEMIYPEPTIRLEDLNGPSTTTTPKVQSDQLTVIDEPVETADLIPIEPRGFNVATYTRLVTQMHAYVQLLGQSIAMGTGF